MTAPSAMQMGEAKFRGGIAVNQPALIKTTHLFCRGFPANEMASLNCGLCRAITAEEREGRRETHNLTSVFLNETSHNNTDAV